MGAYATRQLVTPREAEFRLKARASHSSDSFLLLYKLFPCFFILLATYIFSSFISNSLQTKTPLDGYIVLTYVGGIPHAYIIGYIAA